jgi:uncharacterized protein
MTPASDIHAHIARLFIYPVKSCAGIELQEAVLTPTGLDLDRAWMVVDADGVFVTQRQLPRMALIQPTLKRHEMVLRAPGMLALYVAIESVEEPATVKVWNDVVPAWDMGDVAAQWLTDFLSLTDAGLPATNAPKYRLVRFDPEVERLSSLKWTDGVLAPNQFADGFPVLVASTGSIDELNRKLLEAGHAAVGVERFRPNIVLGGLEPHDEDRLLSYQVSTASGTVVLRPVKPCARCPIPNIDPATAQSSPAVGDTLQTYRQDARMDGAITFGMNAIVISGLGADDGPDTVLRVGQAVAGEFDFL